MKLLAQYTILLVLALGSINAHAKKTEAEESGSAAIEENNEEGIKASQTKIIINVPSRELFLYHKGELVYNFPVAIGQSIYPTPVGPRYLNQIVWNPWWIPPNSAWAKNDKPTPPGPGNPLGPVKMKLGEAIMLHGTSKETTVGTAASHGCMRMYNRDARTLAWWIQKNYSTQDEEILLEKYQTHPRDSFYIQLTQNVPVEIKYDLFEYENGILKAYPDVYSKYNRFNAALAFLDDLGFESDEVKKEALSNFLKKSNKYTSYVQLKDLLEDKTAIRKAKKMKKQELVANKAAIKKAKQEAKKKDLTLATSYNQM